MDQAHASTATAEGRLDHDRIAHGGDRPAAPPRRLAGSGRSPAPRAHPPPAWRAGPRLIAHEAIAGLGRADEHQSLLLAGACEVGVFGQEAVAGMDGFGPGGQGGLDDAVDDEVAFRGWGWTDEIRFVGHLHMQRIPVGLRVYRHGADPSSRQPRITRMAISPRLAMRTLRNIASKDQEKPSAAPLQRNIAMLLRWITIPFILQHVEGADQPGTSLFGSITSSM